MKKIYFLCTGNSCRSQMAEGLAKQILGPDFEIESAGIETHGLNPNAVKVMAEKNIDISQNKSKLIDTHYLNTSDLVITLCGDARDRCPITPAQVKKEHWPLIDPAQAKGTNEEQLAVFREVRDQIETNIRSLKNRINN